MEAKVKETFDVLFQLIDNKVCFECNHPVDQWVSVTNGIFLCDSCVAQHKVLNENVSVTKHIENDSWTEEELLMMKFGGNAKLKAFFEDYSIERVGGSLGFKYCTKAGYYYRRQLKALAQKRIFTEILSEDEAMKLEVPNTRTGESNTNNQGDEDGKDSFEKFDAYVEEKFDTFVDKTHKVVEQVTEKLTDPEFREGVKQDAQRLGNAIVTGTMEFANKVNNTLTDPEFQQNVKEVGGMIADGAKKGFMSAFGFFQKLITDEPSPRFEEEKYDTVYKQEDYGFGGSERSNDREQVHQPTDYPVVRLKPDNVVRSNKQYEVDTLDM